MRNNIVRYIAAARVAKNSRMQKRHPRLVALAKKLEML